MALAFGNRRLLWILLLAAGLSALAWGGRSCLRHSAKKEPSRPAPMESLSPEKSNPPAPAMKPEPPPEKTESPEIVDSPGAALDQALLIPDPISRSMQVGRLFAEWYARDPNVALDYLRNMPRGGEFTSALFLVLADIGQKDAKRALALAGELATNSEQRVVYNILFDQFAARDAKDAIPLLSMVPPGEGRINAVRALMARWTDQDLESSLAWAQGLEDPSDRAPAVESVLFELSKKEPWRALDVAVRNLDGDELERTLTRILMEVKTIDPEKAGNLVRLLPPGETRTHAALNVARVLASRKPASALEWSGTLPSAELQQQVLHNVLDVWLASAPAEASAYVAKMPGGTAQDLAAGHLAENLAAADAAAAVAWAQGLRNPSARQAACVGLASGWARQDPAAAASWAAGLGEGDLARTEAMDAALSYWVLSDSSAAVQYVRVLAAGKIRDDTLDALSELLRVRQPALAADLAASIGNPALRSDVLAQTVAEWAKSDAGAARAWVAGSDLPADEKQRLLGH